MVRAITVRVVSAPPSSSSSESLMTSPTPKSWCFSPRFSTSTYWDMTSSAGQPFLVS